MMRGQTFQSTDAKQYKTSSNRLLASVGDNSILFASFLTTRRKSPWQFSK